MNSSRRLRQFWRANGVKLEARREGAATSTTLKAFLRAPDAGSVCALFEKFERNRRIQRQSSSHTVTMQGRQQCSRPGGSHDARCNNAHMQRGAGQKDLLPQEQQQSSGNDAPFCCFSNDHTDTQNALRRPEKNRIPAIPSIRKEELPSARKAATPVNLKRHLIQGFQNLVLLSPGSSSKAIPETCFVSLSSLNQSATSTPVDFGEISSFAAPFPWLGEDPVMDEFPWQSEEPEMGQALSVPLTSDAKTLITPEPVSSGSPRSGSDGRRETSQGKIS
eukprot:2132068-Rhodomonas_salina.1